MNKFKVILSIIILAFVADLNAQQQVMFTQYMFNGLAINPAYAGSHGSISMSALYRKQWSGIDGAPSTETVSIHSPIPYHKMGVGLTLIHDQIGLINQTGAYGAYAYRLPVTNTGTLSFGLQGGFTQYNAKLSEVSTVDKVYRNDVSEMHPNVGFGMYFNTNRFYLGASVPQLLENNFDKDNADSDSKLLRHYFLTSGYVFDLSHSLKLKPNVLVKYVKGAPVEVDLNANLLINEIIWLGVSYRSFDSFDAILQLQITEKLQLGYSYDFATTTDIRRVNNGSHEIAINFRISPYRTNVITPRYF